LALDHQLCLLINPIGQEYNISELPPAVAASWRSAIDRAAALGATIVGVSLPHTEYAVSAYYIIAAAEAASNLARYDGLRYGHSPSEAKDAERFSSTQALYTRARDEGFGIEVQRRILTGTFVLSQAAYDAYYLKAAQIRSLVQQDFHRAFSLVDVLLTPTSTQMPPPLDEPQVDAIADYSNDVMTIPASLVGLPALSLPITSTAGVQLIADRLAESTLLRVASALELKPY